MVEINSCDALRIIDGLDFIERRKLEVQNIARQKFRALDNDRELERRIILYENLKGKNDPNSLERIDIRCYTCNCLYTSIGQQHLYGICDDCLEVWDDEQLYLGK